MFLTKSFHNEVLEVLRYCDTTFKLLGYEAPILTLTLEELPQDSPWKRLGQQSNELQCSFSGKEPIALLQITKIIVSLVANRSLTPSREQTFGDLIEMLQEVDPLERFLQLIANNNLYWLLVEMLKAKDPAIEIFTDRALECAFSLGDRRLVQMLLDAGADPYACNLLDFIKHGHLTEESHSHCDLVQYILNVQLERDRLAFKNTWEAFIRDDIVVHDFEWSFTLILKSLVHLVRPVFQEECYMIIEAAIAGNQQPFIDRSRILKANCKQDHTFSIIFGGICKIATPKAATEALKLLSEIDSTTFKTSLCCNIEHFYSWDERDVLTLLKLCSIEPNTAYHPRRVLETAVRRDWLEVVEFCFAHGTYLHRNHDQIPHHCNIFCLRCLGITIVHKRGILQNREMLDLFLSRVLAEGKDTMNCWLDFAYEQDIVPDLLKYTIRFWERCYSYGISRLSFSGILEEPRFLVPLLRERNAEAILCLLSLYPSRNSLNELLVDFPTDLMLESRMVMHQSLNKLTFNDSPKVLRHMLDRGLSPSRGLLVWCALACSAETVENLRLIVRAKSFSGQPFSSTDFSLCLDQIFNVYDLWRHWSQPDYPHYGGCSMEDDVATHRTISAWRFFTDHGAACDSAPILKLALGAQSSEEYVLIREFINHGWDPVATAIQANSTTMLGRLFTRGFSQEDYYRGRYYYMTPIQHAADLNKPEIIQMLLQRGVDVNAPAHHTGATALQAASQPGRIQLVTDLILAGADVNAPPSLFGTALERAVASGDLQIVLTLLKSGADVNAGASPLNTTALHEAAYLGHLQIAMELIRAGADVHAPAAGRYRGTVLETAAGEGRLDMVHLLIRNNRNQVLLRKDCRRASPKAKKMRHTVIARLLDEHAQKLAEELGVECEDDIDMASKGSEDEGASFSGESENEMH